MSERATPITDAQRALNDANRIVATAAPDKPSRICALRQAALLLRPHVIMGWIDSLDATDHIFNVALSNNLADQPDAPELTEILQLVAHPLLQEPEEPPPCDTIPEGANGHTVVVTPSPPTSLDVWDAGDDLELPPPRAWLLGNQFCRGFISGLLAPGGTGKSAVRLLQYFSLATGKKLSGQHVFKRGRVLLVSLEDGRDELRRRIAAARLHHGISHDELKDWLYCWAPKGFKLAEVKYGVKQSGAFAVMLRQEIERLRPDLVCLDPFIKLHALEENDNSAMDYVCDLLTQIAIEYDIAVDSPHHTKKGQIAPGDADAGRGASAARDAGRLIHTLTRMSEDEAKLFNVPLEDRDFYLRLDRAKANLVKPSRETTWFKLVSVRLDNGNEDYPNGDEVQTVEPWSPPKLWSNLSSTQLNAVLTDIDAGMPNGQRYSEANAATARAPWPVVKLHCPDLTEDQCREIIKTWLKTGLLYSAGYEDPVERRPRKGLHVDHSKRQS
jgi:hypothetical protein